MVGAIKRWLGIDTLENENLRLAKAILAQRERIDKLSEDLAITLQKNLTTESAKPKIVPRPQRVNWRQAREALEKASEPQEEQ
jgi:hypothetical protein